MQPDRERHVLTGNAGVPQGVDRSHFKKEALGLAEIEHNPGGNREGAPPPTLVPCALLDSPDIDRLLSSVNVR